MKKLACILLAASSFAATADWKVDSEQSTLDFVSVKNDIIAETHQFKTLNGEWKADGTVNITIPVSGLQTHIPIRDERVWEFVLHASQFPTISATTKIAPEQITSLKAGQSAIIDTELALTVLADTVTVPAKVKVIKVSDKQLVAHTVAPVILNTDAIKLTTGVAKLQEVAGLNSISKLVPVTFSVTLKK